MDTLLIQVTNQKVIHLLSELEELHLIKVLKRDINTGRKLSEKYAGKLPSDVADELLDYIAQSS